MKNTKINIKAIKEEISAVLEDIEMTEYEQGYADGYREATEDSEIHTMGSIGLNEKKKKTQPGQVPDAPEEEDISTTIDTITEPGLEDIGDEGASGGTSIESIQKELLKIYNDAKGLKGTIDDIALTKFLTQIKNTAIQFNKLAFPAM